MKVYKPLLIGRSLIAWRIYCFRPGPKDMDAKVGTVVVRIPLKGGGREIIGKISRRYAGDLLMTPSYKGDVKDTLIRRISKILNISKAEAFRTRLHDSNLAIEWSCRPVKR